MVIPIAELFFLFIIIIIIVGGGDGKVRWGWKDALVVSSSVLVDVDGQCLGCHPSGKLL